MAYRFQRGWKSSMGVALLLLFVGTLGAAAMSKPVDKSALWIETDEARFDFTVETAVTDQERMRGLKYRREIAPDRGMIFLFIPTRPVNFTMRETYIPLDMIFIRADGTIESILSETTPLEPGPFSSQGSVKAVLEIKGGEAARLGIEPGDTVHHLFLDNLAD